MSLAGWAAAIVLIALSYFYYYTALYPNLLDSFEKTQYFQITGGTNLQEGCVTYYLEIPRYVAPFDDYQLTLRVKNDEEKKGSDTKCDVLNGFLIFSGEMVSQTARFYGDSYTKKEGLEIWKEKNPSIALPPENEPVYISYESKQNGVSPISFSLPKNSTSNETTDQTTSVNMREEIEVDPGKIKEIPLIIHMKTMPLERLQNETWDMYLVHYKIEFYPKEKVDSDNKEALDGVSTSVSFDNTSSSCVTEKITTAWENIGKIDETSIISWFKNLYHDGNVEKTDTANTWPCSQINPLRAFQQTAIKRMLLSPFSNTLIPIVVLAIVLFVDDALPLRKNDFLPRLVIIGFIGAGTLFELSKYLNSIVRITNLSTSDFIFALGVIGGILLFLRLIVIPLLWTIWRSLEFLAMRLFWNKYHFSDQELLNFWEDVRFPIFSWIMPHFIGSLLCENAQAMITEDPFMKERQRRAFEKVLQVDPYNSDAYNALKDLLDEDATDQLNEEKFRTNNRLCYKLFCWTRKKFLQFIKFNDKRKDKDIDKDKDKDKDNIQLPLPAASRRD